MQHVGETKKDVEAAFQRTKNLLQSLGFVGKFAEPSNISNRVSRFHHRLQRDGIQVSSCKGEAGESRMQEDPAQVSGVSERVGTCGGFASGYSLGSSSRTPSCTTASTVHYKA